MVSGDPHTHTRTLKQSDQISIIHKYSHHYTQYFSIHTTFIYNFTNKGPVYLQTPMHTFVFTYTPTHIHRAGLAHHLDTEYKYTLKIDFRNSISPDKYVNMLEHSIYIQYI